MTAWLKMPKPADGPGDPPHADFETVMSAIERSRAVGVETPAMSYLWLLSPAQEADQWDMPVPLSDLDQFNFDRTVAILRDPFGRGTALLHAGQLAQDEVEAIAAVFPDVYAVMVTRATDDMLSNPPQYPDWAEEVLGILFQKPASTVYTASKGTKAMSAQGQHDSGAMPTQAERRDVSVREAR